LNALLAVIACLQILSNASIAEDAHPADAALAPITDSVTKEADELTSLITHPGFRHQNVIREAATLAKEVFLPPNLVSPGLLELDYDRHRQIRFRKEAALWQGTATQFSAELFAPGSYFRSGVDLFAVENGWPMPVHLRPTMFDVPDQHTADLLGGVQTPAGFRLHYPLNTTVYKDEFMVFLGASYFRAVSRGQVYGLSARGLAIDVAETSGEEFPMFRKFWIERPDASSNSIVVHALLDSKKVSGAYRFSIFPGVPTYVDIHATLFPREELKHVGIAPLTSMFLFGTADRPDRADYRPAVHDSEGVLMLSGRGEWIWRPLNNPRKLQISAFSDQHPQGFGLIQRSRTFSQYEDLEAKYHLRPSAWITPLSQWGKGHVVLVEIPSDSEANDNIVLYWRPEQPLKAGGGPVTLEYRISFPGESRKAAGMVRVIRSAWGWDFHKKYVQVVVDYESDPALKVTDLQVETALSHGTLVHLLTQDNPETGGWRVVMTFDPGGEPLSELRIVPKSAGKQVGETWLYRWLRQ
jgi:glucan biosynthesis protein